MIELFIKFKFLEGLLKEYFWLFILFTVLINNSNAFSQKDSTQQISSQLENTLNWNAKDSIVLDMKNKQTFLYKEGHIDYGEIILTHVILGSILNLKPYLLNIV